jgi:3-phenylpropionate/trans-cinnamate dioxygenase ferredoxin reductase subunit
MMRKKSCRVTVNNESFTANVGDVLLDGALMNGVDLPHDCRTGICGTCKVRLVEGKVFGGDNDGSDMIHACQARIVSDLTIVTEPVPDPVSAPAQVVHMARLAPDVIGVTMEVERPFDYLPGQYCNVQFRGFPARCYSPTYPLERGPNPHLLHFHIRQMPDGAVSTALGTTIRVGHKVRLTGPHGSAFFRPKHPGGMLLVSGGTGFAPMWSIATAAITERPERELIFVVAARDLPSFYMHAALCRLALFPNVAIVPVVTEPQSVSSAFRSGLPTEHLPLLSADDIVYTSGAPGMTDHVARVAKSAGARCYADPFVSNATHGEPSKLMSRLAGWLDSGSAPTLAPQHTPQVPSPVPPQAPQRKPAPKMRMPQDAREYRPRFARSEISNSQ